MEAPQERQLRAALGDRRDREERVQDDDHEADQEQALEDAEQAADHLVDEIRLLEQRLMVVEALDHEGERDRRGDEHGPEADHHGVFVRKLVPVRGQERPERIAKVRREQEREEHRREAEHAADRSLHEAQDEHAAQEQHDQQVEPVDRRDEFPDVHAHSSAMASKAPRPRARRATA